MKPEIVMLMLSSLDGSLHPSRWTSSPDGQRRDWTALYEKVHTSLQGDGWMVGRVTMAEMSKVEAHPPKSIGHVERQVHIATRGAKQYAIVIDPSGRVHFGGGTVGGDHAIVLLGQNVCDSHLAELTADGVSYITSAKPEIDLPAMLDTLNHEFGIKRLLLEGGATINGHFLAAGLVDVVHILVGPAFDGDDNAHGIVSFPGGLAGKCQLSLKSIEAIGHGAVHLCYAVSAPSR
jgi:riboflavin biosynthesis pyrimidine reductase